MDKKNLEMLEFPRIREILASFTSFSVSRELALNLQPLSDYEEISRLLKQSAEARRLLSLFPQISIGEVRDIREAARLAARDKVLEPSSLVEIQGTVTAIQHLRSKLQEVREQVPLLWELASGIADLQQLAKDIAGCVAPPDEVLDSASPKLAVIRRRLQSLHSQLLRELESMVGSAELREIVQEPFVTQREGRYVIPIKIERQKEIKGIVHDVSNTGATVFIEPWVAVELGNELRELAAEERNEVERILSELSIEVGACEPEISRGIELTAELDLALAKARYAHSVQATEPVLARPPEQGAARAAVLKLVEARHPLLKGRAVPLSVEVGRDFSILLVTGPNTGGKTVVLKTLGLLSLMAQAGLPIPASEESCIPIFDGIFADIGDEQSIEQTLSTFSWHMGNIVRIVRNATQRSLVLLDELGASTDPVEGSALARSILRYFLSRGTIAVATTHYGDLKVFAYSEPGLRNASLDFDLATLKPTYHLTPGIPGGSNALATASRLGLPAEIVSAAREMLSQGERELDSLLADLSREKREAETLHRDLEKERSEVEEQSAELESELKQLRTEERKSIREARDKIAHETARLQKEIRRAAADLRKEKSKEKIEQARKEVAAVRVNLESEVWQPSLSGPEEEEIEEGTIARGDTVRLKETNLQAAVLSVSEETGQVELQAGRTRLWIGLDGVEKVVASPDEAVPRVIPLKRSGERRPAPLELDLRGKRAEEVELALDKYLNEASLASLSEVRIIHGFGTGTVRSITRDYLATHPLVRSFRPGGRGEGGDGVTVVSL
ncbi:MAG: endonuclease MutS2 [Chloroflexota bacterium]|nr:endonuclease MutS2 [Chloroflexota bacterium]